MRCREMLRLEDISVRIKTRSMRCLQNLTFPAEKMMQGVGFLTL